MIETNFYKITSYANLFHLEVSAAWDDRVANEYITHRNEIVSRLYIDKNWGILMDMRQWDLHTPEGEESITRFLKKSPSRERPSHYAIVVGGSEIKKWQVENSFDDTSRRRSKFFESLKEARTWLASLGYEMSRLDDK